MCNIGLLWSDRIDIEGNHGWFGCGEINALFEVDFESNKYRYLNTFSDYDIESDRRYSICKKYRNKLFCFPIYGERIWVYDILKNSFSQICIRKSEGVDKLLFCEVFLYNCRLFAVSRGMREILEIDPEKERICNIIKIPEMIRALSGNVVQSNNLIYCTSYNDNILCQIDMDSKEIELYEIPNLKKGICTISQAEGDEFWFSGYDKEIYVWDRKTNQTTILSSFPNEFGIYKTDENNKIILDCNGKLNADPFFVKSINMDKHLWFIPFRTNKVLYVDKKTYEINIFEIPNEQESIEGWRRYLSHKYLVEYIRENRFIGLYSAKNEILLEIDTQELTVMQRYITLAADSIDNLAKIIFQQRGYFSENSDFHRKLYMKFVKDICINRKKSNNIGRNIYKKMI